jgi:hypothetical protein
MNSRKITSLTILLAFMLLLLTSVVLYIVPHGRVAYWSQWKLWGLTKTQWGDLHISIGILFLIAGFLHIYYNWRAITTYLKTKASSIKIFTLNFNISLLITLFVAIGTYYHIPPMSVILQASEAIKDVASERYGEPPYGHAELSPLRIFVKKVELDLDTSVQKLRDAGIDFTDVDETLISIATKNNMSPKEIYTLLKEPHAKTSQSDMVPLSFPDHPQPGFGKQTLATIIKTYALNAQKVEKGLQAEQLTFRPSMTLKEIAEENNKEPLEIFYLIQKSLTP